MRKSIFTFLAIIFTVSIGYSQVTTLWEKSAGSSSLPSWFSTTSTERGLGQGLINGNQRIIVPSRNGGTNIYIYNALTGDSVGTLNNTGISGGLFPVNDADVSTDGVIYVCNMTTDASNVSNPFKVYRYTSESAAPEAVISYNTTGVVRLGDKFTVSGSTSDNSVTIWAASGNTKEIYKFTTTDNGATFTASVITLTFASTSLASGAVGPLANGDFYYTANGQLVQKFLANGTIIDTIPGSVIASGSNAVRYITNFNNQEFAVAFAYGAGNENGRVVKSPNGDLNLAELVGITTSLGSNANGNGTGDVSVQMISNFIYNIYVLSTNNGFGAYQLDLRTQLSGDYYIGAAGTGPGGSDPDYATLEAAFNVINNANITGDCNFFITSNITEPNTSHGLGLAVDPSPHTITFKPYTGVQPVITLQYPVDINSGPSGAFVIGIPTDNNIAWNDLRTTKNIIIDGSNTVGGTTRDLTITTETTSARNAFPVTIVGDVSNFTLKNCNVYYKSAPAASTSNLFIAAVQLRSRLQNALNWTPTNITIENNHISANFPGTVRGAQGIVTVSLAPQPTTYSSGIVIKNNLIEGKQRAIALGWSGNTDIFGNELILNQDVDATVANQVIVAALVTVGSTVNIYDNKISSVSSISNGASAGNSAISIETAGTYNIYNNMIYGFALTAANPTAFLRGISSTSSTATVNLNYNSVYLNNLADIGTGSVAYRGIFISNGTNVLNNNIVQCAETDFTTYCIYRDLALGTLTSNYNLFYPVSATNGNVGYFNAAATPTLADWQTASGQDANSKSKEVFFVSATDLHLTGSSVGDLDLAGTPIAGITTDIDGNVRSTTFPYMGADEASLPLPVELTSFTASYVDGAVNLKWTTATEINNHGFEIERSIKGEYTVIGFIPGEGTTTEKQSYSFSDKEAPIGSNSYRLKQIDFDGHYSYSNTIEVDVVSPLTFSLSQNYPNPFNPVTKINYSIPSDSKVVIAVYSITGEMITELVNNNLSAGSYSVDFNGSNFASGMYIYKMTAGSFTQINKMMLMK